MTGVTAVVALIGAHAFRSSRRLRAQVMQDGLTGLANRRYFDEMIEREFRRASRKGQPLAVIMLDVDHFKDYNDSYGHLAGDECLRALARAIQSCLRRAGDFAARYGGEEIVVVLPDADGPRARALAANIQAAVHALALRHDHNGPGVVTFSGGVAACIPERRAGGWQTLVARADAALYAAKAKGRDLVETT
jgi:diguanylate cyclase (GGDEF)-like protein